jgi:hypothetical protein
LSTIFSEDGLISYLAEVLHGEGTDTDAAWEILEPFLVDAEIAGPTCRAVRMQLALIAPSTSADCEPRPLDEAVIMSELFSAAPAPTPCAPLSGSSAGEKKARRAGLVNFEAARERFLQLHEQLIRDNIAQCFPGQLRLLAPPVSDHVKALFMASYDLRGRLRGGKRRWIPVLHGTNASNHEAIFVRGLLIPGCGNELRIVNGAAHGRGIYTAGLHASWLSRRFCSERRMLVCAVCAGGDLRYVKDAIVVRKAEHVVPLFEAVWEENGRD